MTDIKITQTNVVRVVRSDTGLVKPAGEIPFVLRQDSGVIGGVNDIFALSVPADGDVLLFDPVIHKYKNIPMSGAATINSSGVAVLGPIDCGTF